MVRIPVGTWIVSRNIARSDLWRWAAFCAASILTGFGLWSLHQGLATAPVISEEKGLRETLAAIHRPHIQGKEGAIIESGGQHYVRREITNYGDMTATDVRGRFDVFINGVHRNADAADVLPISLAPNSVSYIGSGISKDDFDAVTKQREKLSTALSIEYGGGVTKEPYGYCSIAEWHHDIQMYTIIHSQHKCGQAEYDRARSYH